MAFLLLQMLTLLSMVLEWRAAGPLVPCADCSRLDNHAALRVAHGGSFVAAGYRQTTTYRAPYETSGRHYYVSAMCARDLPGP